MGIFRSLVENRELNPGQEVSTLGEIETVRLVTVQNLFWVARRSLQSSGLTGVFLLAQSRNVP